MDHPGKLDSDRLKSAIVALVELVARLRGPGGCPWDAAQTDSSVKTYLLEETYEVLDAIENSSPQDVCSELGDLLFQILFLACLAEERSEFDVIEVIEKITRKMIHRHPHVFGQEKVNSAEDVAVNWARIKRSEKGTSRNMASSLKDVPENLPALLRAHRIGERASKTGFDWPGDEKIWDKVQDDFDKLGRAVADKDKDIFGEKMGDLLFSLASLSNYMGFNAEHLLRGTNKKFVKRFEDMEKKLKAAGILLEDGTLEQLKMAWNETGTI